MSALSSFSRYELSRVHSMLLSNLLCAYAGASSSAGAWHAGSRQQPRGEQAAGPASKHIVTWRFLTVVAVWCLQEVQAMQFNILVTTYETIMRDR